MKVIKTGPWIPHRFKWGFLAMVVVLWFLLGGPFYIVDPEEAGVVLTFGRHTDTTEPGFHFKWPWPVQVVYKPAVNIVQRIEIGFRTISENPPTYISFTNDRDMLTEAQMLTGDENIINCAIIVQYRISDATNYLFNVRDQEGTLKDIAEASTRLIVGDNAIDAVLTTGKLEIQTRIMDMVQEIADEYGLGVDIIAVQLMDVQPPAPVFAAFKDVATAREDMQAYINEAESYRNQQIPRARADSVEMVNAALGYSAVRVNNALGEAFRFTAVAEEYRKSPGVTATRLHLETLSSLLDSVTVMVVDESAGALTHYNLGGGAR
ncbi:MAG: FtsH protease activity modulator HflK [Candidatus Fermentibacteraceae bacterium]|nr:FtsH protease activity modulator HflK [Candidatus Fermentibacteraceae bacterium]MBN2608157.1 FtsH protease activity modulator HflK [Candidatus Fermentibacteraceae bacterium]